MIKLKVVAYVRNDIGTLAERVPIAVLNYHKQGYRGTAPWPAAGRFSVF